MSNRTFVVREASGGLGSVGTKVPEMLLLASDSSRSFVVVGLWGAVGQKSRKRGECWGEACAGRWLCGLKGERPRERPGELGADPMDCMAAIAILREGDGTRRRNIVVQKKE